MNIPNFWSPIDDIDAANYYLFSNGKTLAITERLSCPICNHTMRIVCDMGEGKSQDASFLRHHMDHIQRLEEFNIPGLEFH